MAPSTSSPRARKPVSAEWRATVWLAAGLVVLPMLPLLTWDFERSAPLALLPLPLWVGRAALMRAFTRFAQASSAWRILTAVTALIAVFTVAVSTHPAASITALASWVLIGAGALLAGQLTAEDPRRGRFLLGALVVSVVTGVALHWIKWKMGAPSFTAFYAHPRLMGLHTLGGAIAATALFVTTRGLAPAWLVLGVVPWGGLLWTGGRAPLAGLAVALAFWYCCAPRLTRRRILLGSASHLLGGLLLSTALSAGVPYLGLLRVAQSTKASVSVQQFTSNRSVFWMGAVEHIENKPLRGHGPDAYRFLEPKLEGAQPHNVLLQWLLDFGLIGGTLIAILIALVIARALHRIPADGANAGWLTLAIASLTAGQLDGFFYHLMGLYAAAFSLGVCLASNAGKSASQLPSHVPVISGPAIRGIFIYFPSVTVVLAGVILSLHTWITYRIALAPPPMWNSPTARVWRAFPSMTQNLERWIYAWEPIAPEAALELIAIAERQSPFGDFFHVQAAGILLRRGDRAGAQRELTAAHAIAAEPIRPVIETLQRQLDSPAPMSVR